MTSHRVAYRISALVVLLASFYAWDWMPFRVALRDVIAWSIRVSGLSPASFVYEGSPALSVEGKVHYYSPECTYIALLMIVTPFVWGVGGSRRSNILRVGIVALIILIANFVRCWAAVYLDVHGLDRFHAHDLPNYILGIGLVAIATLGALRRDFRDGCTASPKAHAT